MESKDSDSSPDTDPGRPRGRSKSARRKKKPIPWIHRLSLLISRPTYNSLLEVSKRCAVAPDEAASLILDSIDPASFAFPGSVSALERSEDSSALRRVKLTVRVTRQLLDRIAEMSTGCGLLVEGGTAALFEDYDFSSLVAAIDQPATQADRSKIPILQAAQWMTKLKCQRDAELLKPIVPRGETGPELDS
jgi:hypothetical protein